MRVPKRLYNFLTTHNIETANTSAVTKRPIIPSYMGEKQPYWNCFSVDTPPSHGKPSPQLIFGSSNLR